MKHTDLNKLLTSTFMNLDTVNRYSNTKLIEPETDAQHTIRMQLIALELCQQFNFNAEDRRDITYRCLMHDLDEAVSPNSKFGAGGIGDIPRDLKHHDKRISAEIQRVTEEFMEGAFSEDIKRDIDNSKDDTLNGWLVSTLDMIQCLLKLWDEYLMQNSYRMYNRFLEASENSITRVSQYIEFIRSCKDAPANYLDCALYLKDCIIQLIDKFKSYTRNYTED